MNQTLDYELQQVMPVAVGSGLFRVTASFFDRTGGGTPVADSMGQVNQTQVAVAGLQNITALFGVARLSQMFLPDEGARMPSNYVEDAGYHLLLQGYYPAVLPRFTVQITGDPTVYEITPGTVQSDSQHTQTRCKLRRYNQ
jgi:hypothetical protein